MGREILTNDRERSAKAEVQDSELMENALSGQCYALPCRVTDETYIKVKGEWTYLYRAVDRDGQTLDFMLSERRNTAAATKFFASALSNNGIPLRIVIDKSGANGAGIKEVNKMLKRFGCQTKISTVRSKYLNNMIEQDHRFIKRRTKPIPFGVASQSLPGSGWVSNRSIQQLAL